MLSTPVWGVAMRNDVEAAREAPLRRSATAVGNTPHEHSGKGMPKLNQKGARGDLFARIHVSLPRNLNTRQTELFKKLRDNE